MNTPNNNACDFINALKKLNFKDTKAAEDDRQMDRFNEHGHLDLRVCLNYEGEKQPHYISLIKFNGTPARIVQWQSLDMSAHMPTAAILAMLQAL